MMLRLCLALALFSTVAAAQISPVPDSVGIYADISGITNSIHADVGEAFEAYLLITRPTGPEGVRAWELKIGVPDNATVWGWNIQGTYMNLGSGSNFTVAYTEALPLSSAVHLMTFIVVATTSEEGCFTISEPDGDPDQNGYPEYIDDSDINTELRLYPWPAGPDEPAFVMNAAVGNVGKSWGDVKTLFR